MELVSGKIIAKPESNGILTPKLKLLLGIAFILSLFITLFFLKSSYASVGGGDILSHFNERFNQKAQIVFEFDEFVDEVTRVKSVRIVPKPVEGPTERDLLMKVQNVIEKHGRKGVDAQALAYKIVKEAYEQDFDPLFVAAVIKSESAFDKLATSNVGAKGLMQIMPATGKYIENFEDFTPVMNGKLTDPDYNVRLGIRYLKYLENLYKGNRVFVLAAYNWGPGRMKDTFEGKRRIPPEVMNYALKILGDHQKWRSELHMELSA